MSTAVTEGSQKSDVSASSSRGVKKRLRRLLERPASVATPSSAAEPCASCGEETAVGSVLYSDRHDLVVAENRVFLCGECYQRARAAKGAELTHADARTIASNGLVIGMHMLTGR